MARRVLFVQPSLQPPGGGNGVAAWILQALAPDHDVTVVSWRPVAVDPINRFFGTHLRAGEFQNLVVPASWRLLPDLCPVPLSLIKSSILVRYTRQLSDGYDVIIGVNNENDYGRRGIQYIHFPTYLRPRPAVDLRWYHQPRAVLAWYYALADRIAGFSLDRLRTNVSLANSDWTAGHARRMLGLDARTVYPPVADPAPPVPWAERLPHLLAIGRISPEKDYARLIRIVARVRRHLPDVGLTIIGTHDRHARRYFEDLRRLARAHGTMVRFRFDLTSTEVRTAIAAHRYGIHGMREEHFGMAPAEMVRGGCVVWVPRGGGQTEIVGDEPTLLYEEEDEAAEKIVRVMSDPAEQARLRAHLAARGERFSTARFVAEIRDIVAAFEG
jgi:glycosyltransferase involved in cell wall biosynthesis